MQLLHGTALESWQRYKALNQRLQQTTSMTERAELRRALETAHQQFRRAFVEQQVRGRSA